MDITPVLSSHWVILGFTWAKILSNNIWSHPLEQKPEMCQWVHNRGNTIPQTLEPVIWMCGVLCEFPISVFEVPLSSSNSYCGSLEQGIQSVSAIYLKINCMSMSTWLKCKQKHDGSPHYKSAVLWPESTTAGLVEPGLRNHFALSLAVPQKRLLCDCTSSWRNESAVITAACKCIRASRRQIDFSISDWSRVIAQKVLRTASRRKRYV